MFLAAALLLVQTSPAACTATDAALPPPLAGWTAPGDALAIGKPVLVKAADAATVKGLPAGTKPGGAAVIAFRIEKAGTYGVALDQPGWIEVLPGTDGGAALKSATHGRGPDCSTIRKIVRFALQPGSYRVYVSSLAKPQVKLMLVDGE